MPADTAYRAITDDGSFRVVAVRTDATVGGAIAAQRVAGPTALLFAELLSAAALFRETMAPQLQVQCALEGDVKGSRILADAFPDGSNRGLVALADGEVRLGTGKGSLLRMARALPGGRLQEGVVALPAEGGVSAAMMRYMQESEQVVSVVVVTATEGPAAGRYRAGGYMVQMLPEVDRGMLAVMTERLAAFPSLEQLLVADHGARAIAEEVLHGMVHTQLEESPLEYRCPCSLQRAGRALVVAAREEVVQACAEGRDLQTTCSFCNAEYSFSVDRLQMLLSAPTVH